MSDKAVQQARKIRMRILNHMIEKGNYIKQDPLDGSRMVLVAGARQPSTVCGTVPASFVSSLHSDGALTVRKSAPGRFILTEEGQALLRRLQAQGSPDEAFATQHQMLRQPTHEQAVQGIVAINDGESPLAWLRRRRNREGGPMLDETRFVAGERLRADMNRAQMLPRVTANWTSAVASSARGVMALDPTDAMVSARQRVDRALAAVGPDLAGVLIDICGFLKGLSDIERERHWPARSGKVVLDIALGRLAAHYGLSPQAVGAGPAGRGILAWAAADAPPQVNPQPAMDAAS